MKYCQALVVAAAVALTILPASAQTYPSKPIKIVVSTSAGGATDIMARILGHHITTRTGQPHVIDNRAGASVGTTPDLTGGEFARRAGLDKLVVVPFRGTAPATAAVIGGEVQVTFVSMGPHIEFVRNGTLRVLAAATPSRRPYVPDVPT